MSESNTNESDDNYYEIVKEYYKEEGFAKFSANCRNSESCNDRGLRFLKGRIREKSLAKNSNKNIEHIDEVGYDLKDKNNGKKIEFKTACLLTRKYKQKVKTITATIINVRGNIENRQFQGKADYYIFGGTDGLVMCSCKTLTRFIKSSGDCWKCLIPFNECKILFLNNSDYRVITEKAEQYYSESNFDFAEKINELIESFIII